MHRTGHHARFRPVPIARAVVLAVLAAFVVTAAPALAQDLPPTAQDLPPTAQEDQTLTVRELGLVASAGYTADAPIAGWVPVEVRLTPTRLFGGTLEVLANPDGIRVVEQVDIEVAAGTEKVFRFVVPPTGSVQLRLTEPGRDPLTSNVTVPLRRSSSFVVGLLGAAVPASPPPIAAVASDLRGVYAAIDPAWLDVSPRALDPVSTLVVTATDLGQLGEAAVARIRNAVAIGMELVVVADRAGAIDLEATGLPWSPATGAAALAVPTAGAIGTGQVLALTPSPEAWTLTTADLPVGDADEALPQDPPVLIASVSAGRGRVSVTGVALGGTGLGGDARLWGHVLQPSARAVDTIDPQTVLSRPLSLAQEAVRSSGLSLPSLPWLTVFLIAFVLLVGPLNGLVLRRVGRPELAWVTIPAITLVFAAGAYVGARGAQPPIGLAASATYWIDGHGQQLAVSAVRSPREGEHTVTFPGSGWAVLPATTTSAPSRVDHASGDTTVTTDLGALQVGTAMGWRATDGPPPVEVVATSVDGATLTVEITNRSDGDLEDVVVHAGSYGELVGDLAAGEQTTVELDRLDTLPAREPWRDDFEGLRDNNGSPPPPRSLEALLRWGVLDANPGLIWVVASADRAPGALPGAAGGATEDLGGVVAVGVTPAVTGGALGPATVTRTLLPVSANQGMGRPSTTAIEGPGQAVLRYRLPDGVAPTALIPTLNRGVGEGGQMGFDGGVDLGGTVGGGTVGGGFGEFPAEECFTQPLFDGNGNVIGEQETCQGVAVEGRLIAPVPVPPEPFEVPECPPDAECSLDGNLWEVCRNVIDPETGEERGRECSVTILGPAQPPPDPFGNIQLEVFDHDAGNWVFLQEASRALADGTVSLDPGRFLGPLGEVFVRAAGELWPFDYSGRGIGAILGGAT